MSNNNYLGSRNSSIDSFRLIMALTVIYIHGVTLHLPCGLDAVMGPISRMAVPFFFAVSGYFVYHQDYSKQMQSTLVSIKKCSLLFCGSTLVYIIFGILFKHISLDVLVKELSPRNLIYLLLSNEPLDNMGSILWFLLALISLNIILFLNAKIAKRDFLLLIFGIIGYFIGYVAYFYIMQHSDADPSLYKKIHILLNWFTDGLIFYAIGYFIAKYKYKILKIPLVSLFIGGVVSLLLYYSEVYVLGHLNQKISVQYYQDLYLALPIVTLFLLITIVRFPNFLENTDIPRYGARYAVYIYLWHRITLEVLAQYGFIKSSESTAHNLIYWFLVFACTLFVSVVYVYFRDMLKVVAGRIRGDTS